MYLSKYIDDKMKNIIPKVKDTIYHYGLAVLLLMVFLAGIYFIFWMGKSSEWIEMEDELTELRDKVVTMTDIAQAPASR